MNRSNLATMAMFLCKCGEEPYKNVVLRIGCGLFLSTCECVLESCFYVRALSVAHIECFGDVFQVQFGLMES